VNKVIPSILVLVGVGLGFIFGYLAGSGPPTNRVTISPTVQSKLTSEMVRDEIDAALELLLADLRNGRGAPASSSTGAAIPIHSDARTPAWDMPLEDLEKAIERLNRAVTAMQSHGVVPLSSQVQMAQSGRYPQKSAVVRAFCRRWEKDERDEEIKLKELLFLSPIEVLERFGEPNNIELEVGSLFWEYEYIREDDDGTTYGWDMYLVFTDGAVMDASCSFYDDEDRTTLAVQSSRLLPPSLIKQQLRCATSSAPSPTSTSRSARRSAYASGAPDGWSRRCG